MTSNRDSLGLLIHQAAQAMRRRFEKRGSAHGLSAAQWRVLLQLKNKEGIAQARLATLLEIEPISVSRLLDRMQESGWIERRPDAEDRRVRMIHPTEKAHAVFSEMRSVADEIYDEALAGLDRDQRAAFVQGLRKIVENLSDEDHGCDAQPAELAGIKA